MISNFEKKKRIRKIGALFVLGMFVMLMLAGSAAATDYDTSGDGYVGNSGAERINFDNTNGEIEMLGGNVGIGVTNPAEKLEIDGDILLNTGVDRDIYVETPSSASNGYDLEIKAGNGYATFEPTTGGDLTLRAGTGGSGAAAGFGGDVYIIGGGVYTFANNIGDVILLHDGTNAGGKVGIMTTSPGAILDVRGDAVFNEDSVDYDFRIESDNDANMFFVDGGNNNIGIGTISPSAKLHIIQTGASDAFRVDDQSSDTTPFVIDQSGNVGIGTASPSSNADLTLEGGVICLKETTTPTADTDYGKIYTKSDNKLYFQDGAGTEWEIQIV